MLQFKHSTKVHRLESRGTDIPKFSFKFCPFDKLPEMNTLAKPLQDVLGVISHVGPFDYASPTSSNKLRIIKIRNLDEQTQEIRLWGHHGETFDEQTVFRKAQEGIVVGIFAGVTASDFLGTSYLLHLQMIQEIWGQIAFSTIAAELVGQDAIQVSQNMKIDAAQHVATLDNAIGKTKLFHIGMKVDSTSRFPISYVIRKSFSADNGQMLPSTESSSSKELITTPSSSMSTQSPIVYAQDESYTSRSPTCSY